MAGSDLGQCQAYRKALELGKRKALRNGSIGIIPILLPKHSPWLNPPEAIVGQAKRRVLGNRRLENLQEMEASLEAHFKCRNRCYAGKD